MMTVNDVFNLIWDSINSDIDENLLRLWKRKRDVSENVKSCGDFITTFAIQGRFELTRKQEENERPFSAESIRPLFECEFGDSTVIAIRVLDIRFLLSQIKFFV